MLIRINPLTQTIFYTWDHEVQHLFLLVLWQFLQQGTLNVLKLLYPLQVITSTIWWLAAVELRSPFVTVFIFLINIPQPFFDQHVLLFGDALSIQRKIWVVTGRELLKLPTALMTGISSGITQPTARNLWLISLKLQNLSSWTNTSRGVSLSMARQVPAIWSVCLRWLLALTLALCRELVSSEWSAATFPSGGCIMFNDHPFMLLGSALNSQFRNISAAPVNRKTGSVKMHTPLLT